jgi:hypothetical protein
MSYRDRARGKKSRDRNKKGDKPVDTVRAPHGLKVSVWENEYPSDRGRGETFIAYSALPVRSYYDDDKKEYVDTHYLREDDLLPMAELLRQIWSRIQMQKDEQPQDDERNSAPPPEEEEQPDERPPANF